MEFTHFTVDSGYKIMYKRVISMPTLLCRSDKLYIKNVLNFSITSDEWYPVISMTEDLKDPQYPRSLHILNNICEESFYSENCTFIKANVDRIKIAIRDLYLLSLLDSDLDSFISKDCFANICKNSYFIDSDAVWVDNVPVCFYPSRGFDVLRFIDKDSMIDTRFAIYNDKRVVFLRKKDISFYNFENVISVELPMFEEKIYNFREMKENDIFTFDIDSSVVNALLSLDGKNFYLPPLNDDERGGKRFVFSSEKFASYLYAQLKGNLNDSKFKKVNNLFRYNKFLPRDSFFKNHYDIPYVDKTNKEFSVYTLIIYLKVSDTEPSLLLEGEPFKFHSGECIIFKQNYKHEGRTFKSDDKIFLRTDLIFQLNRIKIRKESTYLSYLFNEACYISRKAFHYNTLKEYVTETFNHYNNVLHDKVYERKVYKYFLYRSLEQPLTYLTNGNFYIFNWDNRDCNKESLLPYIRAILEDYLTNDSVYINTIESDLYIDSVDSAKKVFEGLVDGTPSCKCLKETRRIRHVCGGNRYSGNHGLYCDCYFSRRSFTCLICADFHAQVYCCKRCCKILKENFNPKLAQSYLLKTSSNIVDEQFDLSNIRVVSNKIYFKNKRRFHYAQALYCDCKCKKGFYDAKLKTETKKLKRIVNTFISYCTLSDPDLIIFSLDLFKNNVTFKEIEESVMILEEDGVEEEEEDILEEESFPMPLGNFNDVSVDNDYRLFACEFDDGDLDAGFLFGENACSTGPELGSLQNGNQNKVLSESDLDDDVIDFGSLLFGEVSSSTFPDLIDVQNGMESNVVSESDDELNFDMSFI